ncbi:MAG: NAD(P)/FAD-dependent oxidoreductase [Bacillota bacterium]|uniref:FAD-dependent oxidoreductase n=1 Tax=Thermanaerosceptrum fracticalcis TaxID=1712410 RepID=A0A7G6E4Y0_THEFR|nr:FAD-dependent oxidoreductase [Thermanaerosceptrum fracticalcis]QNB47134.1 FAD-dependent oxidoreductase [Thermanaerosceptrum fracticalcis]
MKKNYDVVVVGAGPAGIFAALEMTFLNKDLKILVVDKGRLIDDRHCPIPKTGKCARCQPCSIMSGWAGAGAFSDGKLSLSPEVGGRITDYISEEAARRYIRYADSIYLRFGAREEVHGLENKKIDDMIYDASKYNIQLIPCPVRHLGTELSFEVLRRMYIYLTTETKTEFLPLTTVTELLVEDGAVNGVALVNTRGEETVVSAPYVIAAPGRGGAGWLSEQAKKLHLKTENNEVDIGVRVEVPNSIMDHLTRELYEAKLVYYSDTFENKVRSFCMNPGGIVSEENYDGEIAVVNGHSYADPKLKTTNTNFALLVSTRFTEPFNQPIEYGKYIAKCANMLTGGGVMIQRLGDLLKGRRTDYSRLKKSTTIPTLKSAVPGDLSFVLPQRYLTSIVETLKAFDNIAPGLYSKNTLLYGVEVKFYSSKMKVNNNLETDVKGLYTIGDGAGITRGLMQASVSGILVAQDIVKKLN